jgi:hypothetical protein
MEYAIMYYNTQDANWHLLGGGYSPTFESSNDAYQVMQFVQTLPEYRTVEMKVVPCEW